MAHESVEQGPVVNFLIEKLEKMSILMLVWFTHDPVRNCKTVVITAEVDSTSVHSTSFMFENVCALCGWSVVPGFPGGFPMIYGLWFTRLLAPSFIS